MDNYWDKKIIDREMKITWPYTALIVFVILILLTIATKFYGSTDIADYSDTAKYFAGEYHAKIRSTHSYLFGFVHAPFVYLTKSFFLYKVLNLLVLASIIYSVYHISGKHKNHSG